MAKLIESKFTAWLAMLLAVVLVVLTFLLRSPWYSFIAVFFCFIAVFAHLASLYLQKMSRNAARKLEAAALICIILAVLGFFAEYIIFEVMADL